MPCLIFECFYYRLSWCSAKFWHWGLVQYILPSKIGQHWFKQWLGACRCQAIVWTNDVLFSTENKLQKIWIKIQQLSFNKMQLRMSSEACQSFSLSRTCVLQPRRLYVPGTILMVKQSASFTYLTKYGQVNHPICRSYVNYQEVSLWLFKVYSDFYWTDYFFKW